MFNPILFRHQLHRAPELSGCEVNTQSLIASTLESFGFSPITNVGGCGVIVDISAEQDGPHLLFRADTDALPIQEVACHSHASENTGVMHACGHDGHSASLMAFAHKLSQNELLRGRVTLVFQPSEENGCGAAALLADPRWEPGKVDYAFGYHNIPGFPLGQIVSRENTFSCASTGVVIRLTGTTAHAAYPETALNPTRALCALIQAIEQLPAQFPQSFVLTTVVHANLGKPAFGTTPGEGVLMVTLRSDSNKCFDALCEKVEGLAIHHAAMDNLDVSLEWDDRFNATINHSEANMLLHHSCKTLGFDVAMLEQPMRWSEDFAEYAKRWPAAFFGIGSGEEHPPLHDQHYDFPDALIDISSKVFAQIVKDMNGLRAK